MSNIEFLNGPTPSELVTPELPRSDKLDEVLGRAGRLAERYHLPRISPLVILEEVDGSGYLDYLWKEVEPQDIHGKIRDEIVYYNELSGRRRGIVNPPLSNSSSWYLAAGNRIARQKEDTMVFPDHFARAYLGYSEGKGARILNNFGVHVNQFLNGEPQVVSIAEGNNFPFSMDLEKKLASAEFIARQFRHRYVDLLHLFVAMATEGDLNHLLIQSPVYREDFIGKATEILEKDFETADEEENLPRVLPFSPSLWKRINFAKKSLPNGENEIGIDDLMKISGKMKNKHTSRLFSLLRIQEDAFFHGEHQDVAKIVIRI